VSVTVWFSVVVSVCVKDVVGPGMETEIVKVLVVTGPVVTVVVDIDVTVEVVV
jgi:hypothetical protein